jgi:hypothetical protein
LVGILDDLDFIRIDLGGLLVLHFDFYTPPFPLFLSFIFGVSMGEFDDVTIELRLADPLAVEGSFDMLR